MQIGDPVESLAAAVYSAVYVDLPPVQYRNWTPAMKQEGLSVEGVPLLERRPRVEECTIYHFPQTWGSTALGFGGMGGATMTSAYTTVVFGPSDEACVYFAGRLAYRLDRFNEAFVRDLANHKMASVRDSGRYRCGE